MSDVRVNMFLPADGAGWRISSDKKNKKKKKRQRFNKKMRFLQKKGCLEVGCENQRFPGQGKAPRQNGENTEPQSLHTSTHNRSLPPSSSSKASASHSSSEPSASTHGLPSSSSDAASSTETPKELLSRKPTTSSSSSSTAATGIPSKYLAVDCEMVGTGPKGSISQLGRCSIVSYDGDVVYDKFIKPSVRVTDYRTRWSGIRHSDLINAQPYHQARKEILRLLMGKVVIGHAVHNDFKVLGYSHPTALTRDTSRSRLLNLKGGFGENECVSLKRLTKAILHRDIQTGKRGHSSVEDARSSMELYKVVQEEWEKMLASTS